jgi:hypothetical protein
MAKVEQRHRDLAKAWVDGSEALKGTVGGMVAGGVFAEAVATTEEEFAEWLEARARLAQDSAAVWAESGRPLEAAADRAFAGQLFNMATDVRTGKWAAQRMKGRRDG